MTIDHDMHVSVQTIAVLCDLFYMHIKDSFQLLFSIRFFTDRISMDKYSINHAFLYTNM